jgi:cardiolipin synthase
MAWPPVTLSQLPNLITLARIGLVPVLILFLKESNYLAALIVFVVAGLSDGVDGFIAKRYGYTTHFGAVLDPVADKLLLVSAYVMLTFLNHIPFWLMLLVAFRDVLIVGGYLAYTSHMGPVRMRPSLLSKFNTFMQIALVIVILFAQAAAVCWPRFITAVQIAVLLTTVASMGHYLWVWFVKKEIEHVKDI